MKNPIALALALCLLLLAFVILPTSQSDATLTPTIQHDLTVATVAAIEKSLPQPQSKFASYVNTDLADPAAAAQPPESSDEPISAASAGAYGSATTSGSAGAYGSYQSGSSSGTYGSYNSGSSSGAYGSYNSGSSSGSYGAQEVAFHGPVRGFFRNGGLLRRGIIRGRWQAHGPHGGVFSGGCSHCRS